MRHVFKPITSIAIALASLAVSANAAIISVNIGNTSTDNLISSGQSAGVVAASNWNNKLGSFGAATVTDDSGTLLATTVSVNTQWSGGLTSAPATPNQALMDSGTDTGGGDATATITAIPYDLYDVYVYIRSSSVGRYGDYSVTPSGAGAGGAATLRGYSIGAFGASGTFIEETTGDSPGEGNYIRFRNVSGENLVIRADPQNPSPARANIAGFQIVQVPEPSAALLLGLGGIALTLRRRRK